MVAVVIAATNNNNNWASPYTLCFYGELCSNMEQSQRSTFKINICALRQCEHFEKEKHSVFKTLQRSKLLKQHNMKDKTNKN